MVPHPRRHERGITGLETAIVLIAFVVVASVFAFAILSQGLLASQKSEQAALSGLEGTSATVVLRGTVIGVTTTFPIVYITDIKFQLTNASRVGTGVNLSNGGTYGAIVTYIDADQTENISTWTTNWLTGSGPILDPGETVEIDVDISGLATVLTTNKEFTIQLAPIQGATLRVNRTTPAELTTIIDLG